MRLRLWRALAVPILCTSCVAAAPGLGSGEPVSGVELVDEVAVEGVDAIVEPYLDDYCYINVALVVDGEIVLTRCYGRDRLDRREVYASVSKPVTAMLTLAVHEEGTIADLDDPIGEYCAKYADAMPEEYEDSPITFRHLLSHRSGLPHQSALWSGGKLVVEFRPGSAMSYSTKGYAVLGEVLEAETGKSYDALVKEYIGAPVGAASLRADDLFFETPAGRVWSTVEDMARFALGVIDDTYISEELAAGTILLSGGEDSQGRMGMGWYISGEGTEDVALYHAGSNGRPRAFLAVKPFRARAVALAGRARSADGPHDFGALTIELMAVVDGLASP